MAQEKHRGEIPSLSNLFDVCQHVLLVNKEKVKVISYALIHITIKVCTHVKSAFDKMSKYVCTSFVLLLYICIEKVSLVLSEMQLDMPYACTYNPKNVDEVISIPLYIK